MVMLRQMEKRFEELAYHRTERGELSLRRRKGPMLDDEIFYEVILNDEFLMTSLFHAAEDALAHLALQRLEATRPAGGFCVAVGGLGLGYTAAAALAHDSVAKLRVIDVFAELIGWHREALVPLGKTLCGDSRCELVEADFFALAQTSGLSGEPTLPVDALLLDIDHTPQHWLHPTHASFYTEAGLAQVKQQIRDGGVFAMWADGPPDAAFIERLAAMFVDVEGRQVDFPNPIRGGQSCGTVYLGTA